jgi:hypothetical protein
MSYFYLIVNNIKLRFWLPSRFQLHKLLILNLAWSLFQSTQKFEITPVKIRLIAIPDLNTNIHN